MQPIEFRGGPLDGERYQDVVRGAIADKDAPAWFTMETPLKRPFGGGVMQHTYELEGGAYRHRSSVDRSHLTLDEG